MSRKPPGSIHPTIPADENRCVWMSAGVLTYQLCDRELDCDHCALDHALHTRSGHAGRPTQAATEDGTAGDEGTSALRRDRLYSRQHCWVLWCELPVGEDTLLRIGLEPGLAAALPAPRSVAHPETGAEVRRGDTLGWIMTDGGTLELRAPLSGTLHQANRLVLGAPELLCSRPLDEGWLCSLRVAPSSADFGALVSAGAAERLYRAAAHRFTELLRAELADAAALLPASPAGQAVLQDVAAALGPARYFSLLRKVYG
jgi:glycine cleavage system H protein